MQMLYLMAAALIFVGLDREHFFPLVVPGILAVLQIVVLQIMVPYDTGLLNSAELFTIFVISVTASMATLIGIVTFALSEVERAEANVADKSLQLEMANKQLEMADRYKSHFLASASHDLR